MKTLTLLLLSAVFIIPAFRTGATTFYVNVSNTVPASPFITWATAATNIQNAIDASSDGDLIFVTNGVYATGGSVVYGSLTNRVVINKAVTVQSVNGPANTFIRGNSSLGNFAVRCVYLTNNATLLGFTLTNGTTRSSGDNYEERSGGGIWCESTSSTVSNCVVVNNKSSLWGGGTVSGTLISCTLTNNTTSVPATSQGGGALAGILTNCIIVHNSAAFGGGAASNTLLNCTLAGNWATVSGGATYSSALTNCTLSGNWSTNGGGAAFGMLVGCTLTNNSAGNGGGACSNRLIGCLLINNKAITNGGGTFFCTLSNSTLSANSAFGSGFTMGGGAYGGMLYSCVVSNNYAVHGGGVASNCLTGCILFSNTAADGGGAFSSTLNSCILTNNTASSQGGGSYGGVLNGCVLNGNRVSMYGGGAEGGNLNNCLLIHNSIYGPSGAATAADNCNSTNCTIIEDFGAGGGGPASGTSVNCIIIPVGPARGVGGTILNCCIYEPGISPGASWITNDPAFVNRDGGDYHLQSNSPCIDAGNNAYTNSITDLDGRPRVVNGTVDIGAYEFQGTNLEPFVVWLDQYGLPDDGSADYADSDGTGMNNWQKWIAGLNPTNIASVLALKPPAVTVSNATITWSSVTNRTYYVQRSSNLSQSSFSSIQSNIVGQINTTSYTDTNAVGSGSFFYRVGVQ